MAYVGSACRYGNTPLCNYGTILWHASELVEHEAFVAAVSKPHSANLADKWDISNENIL